MYFSLLFTLFFFNDTATTEIYTLSLHDALPICERLDRARLDGERAPRGSEQLLIVGCRVGGGCGRRVQIHDGHYGTGWIGVRGETTEARLTSVLRRLTIISDGNHQALFEGADRVAEGHPAIPPLAT